MEPPPEELIRWSVPYKKQEVELIVYVGGSAKVFERDRFRNSFDDPKEAFAAYVCNDDSVIPYSHPIKIDFDLYYDLRELGQANELEDLVVSEETIHSIDQRVYHLVATALTKPPVGTAVARIG